MPKAKFQFPVAHYLFPLLFGRLFFQRKSLFRLPSGRERQLLFFHRNARPGEGGGDFVELRF